MLFWALSCADSYLYSELDTEYYKLKLNLKNMGIWMYFLIKTRNVLICNGYVWV
jgi:hypothetical protein